VRPDRTKLTAEGKEDGGSKGYCTAR
jgi:hypothetical protein